MKDFIEPLIAVATAIVGLAIVAVLVSNKSSTSGVITSLTGGFANDLQVAVSPITGGTGGFTGF